MAEDTTGRGAAIRRPDPGRWSIARDENLGKIHELVIEVKDGRLVYGVLSIGDFPGMVNQLVCYALESLRIPRHGAQAHPQLEIRP